MTFLMKTAFQKSQITEEELSGIRIQFEGLQRDATSYRNRMDKVTSWFDRGIFDIDDFFSIPFLQENARKSEAISNLESDLKTSTTKLVKYKEQNETLQATIKEHIDVQEELQAKLKTEAKTVSGENHGTRDLTMNVPGQTPKYKSFPR